ncbi:MAG: MBOAT family protein [bacterium]|nr:MBOAT family protein [bacterium]
MLFNSLEFLFVFLPLALLVFFGAARLSDRAAIISLALLSIAFYSWWDIRFLPVLGASIAFNYLMAKGIERADRSRKPVLAIAITLNLATLFLYKYLDFSIASINAAFHLSIPLQHLALPLGISFFTFTQIAYLVDVYKKEAHTSQPADYLLFVTYFPHLIAGPILHHAQMMPQFKTERILKPHAEAFVIGIIFITIGLVKKVLVADHIARYATPVFAMNGETGALGALEAWTGILAYSLQLYFDFSGYCDMAIGISLLFNIDLPLNFASPYKSASIIEFWRRWHMTLSQFLRNYLYIPLGGNRQGTARRYTNLFLTMLLGGLWHGANWTFVVWGCMHGLYLIINHGFSLVHRKLGLPEIPAGIGLLLTFIAVVFAWVPFRADNLTDTVSMWKSMLAMNGIGDTASMLSHIPFRKALAEVMAGILVVMLLPNSQQIAASAKEHLFREEPAAAMKWTLAGLLFGIIFSYAVMSIGHVSEFLYFQF